MHPQLSAMTCRPAGDSSASVSLDRAYVTNSSPDRSLWSSRSVVAAPPLEGRAAAYCPRVPPMPLCEASSVVSSGAAARLAGSGAVSALWDTFSVSSAFKEPAANVETSQWSVPQIFLDLLGLSPSVGEQCRAVQQAARQAAQPGHATWRLLRPQPSHAHVQWAVWAVARQVVGACCGVHSDGSAP